MVLGKVVATVPGVRKANYKFPTDPFTIIQHWEIGEL